MPFRVGLVPLVPDAAARAQHARLQPSASHPPPAWGAGMTRREQFARALLTLRGAFGGGAGLDYWARLAQVVLGDGDGSADGSMGGAESVSELHLKVAFAEAWEEAAAAPATAKARVAAKTPADKVGDR